MNQNACALPTFGEGRVRTRKEVREVWGSCQTKRTNSLKKNRTAAACYLAQLAESVRAGEIAQFDIEWDGVNITVRMDPSEP